MTTQRKTLRVWGTAELRGLIRTLLPLLDGAARRGPRPFLTKRKGTPP